MINNLFKNIDKKIEDLYKLKMLILLKLYLKNSMNLLL